jgi:excinuclease ABC subunit C
MGGKNMVGVMTVVEDGEVNKNEYRKFKIRTQNDANDTGALKEVLERRLAHTEWTHPALIVVDGGVAQINAAKKVLNKIKSNIPIVSVLKDEKHKPKAIMGDEKMGLKYKREILLANSEAHRFAITYHKKMRNKNFLKS